MLRTLVTAEPLERISVLIIIIIIFVISDRVHPPSLESSRLRQGNEYRLTLGHLPQENRHSCCMQLKESLRKPTADSASGVATPGSSSWLVELAHPPR